LLAAKAPTQKARALRIQRWLLISLPLLLLGIDIAISPIFLESSGSSSGLSAALLVSKGVVYLGNFRSHRIYVSLDDISDSAYPGFVQHREEDGQAAWGRKRRTGTALAISIVKVEEGWTGSLLTSLLHKLAVAAPDDHDKLIDRLGLAQTETSDVLWYDFSETSSATSPSFSVDHLLLLKLHDQKKEIFASELQELLSLAGQEHLSELVLPCLGSDSDIKGRDRLSCADTYTASFQGLGSGESPESLYFSLYKRWPDVIIAQELESLNGAWKSALAREATKYGPIPILHEADVRLMLLFLSVCLLTCSFRIQLTFRNFLIICVSFIPVALELQDKLTPLISQLFESSPAWAIKSSLLAVLSSGYLFFISFDIKNLFGSHDTNNSA
jgi:hypothetical protein